MSLIDDAIAAVTPIESQQDRAEARSKARAIAKPGDWFALILDHHEQLEKAFADAKAAGDAASRTAAGKRLGVILTGHAIAEEAVVYPAMVETGDASHANHGYDEQATVKQEMAALEKIEPMSADYLDKLDAIREAVAHHMYEEEGTWYPDLARNASAADQVMVTRRYKEEFDRYVGADAGAFSF